MSGGHYEYLYFKLTELADYIENDFVNDGKFMDKDWSISGEELLTKFGGKPPNKEFDRLEDATEEERKIILKEIKSLIINLKKCSKRAKELEWYMSGDTGAQTYLERLKNI